MLSAESARNVSSRRRGHALNRCGHGGHQTTPARQRVTGVSICVAASHRAPVALSVEAGFAHASPVAVFAPPRAEHRRGGGALRLPVTVGVSESPQTSQNLSSHGVVPARGTEPTVERLREDLTEEQHLQGDSPP
jgi:hypothetical protein